VGGGVQERLGAYLQANLDQAPAIHCIGAAIGFLSGAQVRIPMWADRWKLGWFFRCLSAPRTFVPRYWDARRLVPLMLKFGERMPEAELR
jgi:N-acetylglucosaminyldiphosphoundecaprenol N-acetyl-beta-D-mannosaminyltransferase